MQIIQMTIINNFFKNFEAHLIYKTTIKLLEDIIKDKPGNMSLKHNNYEN